MIYVPKEFQLPMPFPYPASNHLIFEEWFFQNWKPEDARERKYLPIFVNGYQVGNNYGQNKPQMDKLQKYLNSIDPTLKYYMITQYDDGLLCNIDHLDIRVYAMSSANGSRIDYALPLICQPMPFKHEPVERKFLANFIGRITHPIRNKVVEQLQGRKDCFCHVPRNAWEQMNEYHYSQILAQSVFTICPRGYGWNSFRIAEALQYGSIPVIISDEYRQPHNKSIDGLYVMECDIQYLYKMLTDASLIVSKTDVQKDMKECYDKYFTYEANKEFILEDLKNN